MSRENVIGPHDTEPAMPATGWPASVSDGRNGSSSEPADMPCEASAVTLVKPAPPLFAAPIASTRNPAPLLSAPTW